MDHIHPRRFARIALQRGQEVEEEEGEEEGEEVPGNTREGSQGRIRKDMELALALALALA